MRYGILFLVLALVNLGVAAGAGEFAYSDQVYAELDPARIRGAEDERLVLALFEPLTSLDPRTGEVAPGAAERWEAAADGRTWTFHLRPTARWSDGSPVRAQDFVDAWRRALDPYEPSRWAWAFRPIDTCADIADTTAALDAVTYVRSRLDDLVSQKGDEAIPGGETRALLARSGLARYVGHLESDAVKAFALGGGKDLPAQEARGLADALKAERRRLKKAANGAFDAFGRGRGVQAKDERTLIVSVARPCPWLPALLARGFFAPLEPDTIRGGESAFLPGELVSNGPFVLKGRGAKPHAGMQNPLSVVHLIRSPTYDGARKAQSDAVFCFTGQGAEEDLRRLEAGELQWMPNPAAALGARLEKVDGFQVHPGRGVVLVRFRCDRPPFDQPAVRQAFCDALQDAPLPKACWPEAQPALRLVPPNVAGGGGPSQSRQGGAKAKAALKAAGLTGEQFPWVELRYTDRGCEEELADRLVETWTKKAGVELGLRIESETDLVASVRAGAYEIALDSLEPLVDDPEAFVLAFSVSEADGGVGWSDAPFEALCDGVRDPAALAQRSESELAVLQDVPGIPGALQAARGGAAPALDALRRACLDAAEKRLLDAYVVAPLVFPQRAFVLRGGAGVGAPAAWRNPAFLGALWSAR